MQIVNRTTLIGIAVLSALLVTACSDVKTAPQITASSTVILPTMSAPTSGDPAAPVTFHTPTSDAGWSNIPVTARFCGIENSVQLSGGEASSQSSKWGSIHVFVFPENIQLEGVSGPLVAKKAMCDNGGGTAAGNLAYAYLLFASDERTTRVLAELPAQQPTLGEHPTMVNSITGSGETFTVDEAWFRLNDANCCPSGAARTVWRVTDAGADVVSAVVVG